MKPFNHPVTSREYKLMLNVERFKEREQGIKVFMSLIEFLIAKENGKIVKMQNNKEKDGKRITSFLDTKELALHQNGYSLRLRDEAKAEDRFQINLKYRSPDRYLAAAQDLSCTHEKCDLKFEEDITPPFVSKFSHSISIKTPKALDISTMEKLTVLFPGLKQLSIDKKTAIATAKKFHAYEIVRKLCQFQFGDDSLPIKACLSFWYLTEKMEDWPLIGEFSFDYDMPEKKVNGNEIKQEELELYPSPTVEGANRFFSALQNQAGWINFSATTKTAFALEAL